MNDHTLAAILAALALLEGPVEVLGEGQIAQAVTAAVGGRPGKQLAGIVDLTGDAVCVKEALGRVADLGTVVLAGPYPERPVVLDLYADLHLRGLTLIGVPPTGEGRE